MSKTDVSNYSIFDNVMYYVKTDDTDSFNSEYGMSDYYGKIYRRDLSTGEEYLIKGLNVSEGSFYFTNFAAILQSYSSPKKFTVYYYDGRVKEYDGVVTTLVENGFIRGDGESDIKYLVTESNESKPIELTYFASVIAYENNKIYYEFYDSSRDIYSKDSIVISF